MESKIEKLVIYYDEILGKDRDIRILDMANKIDEIIDHLNSQAQPEEKIIPIIGEVKPMSKKEWKEFQKEMVDTTEEIDNTKLVMPPSAYEQAEKEGFDMRNKVKSELLPEDTPEEWEEDFEGMWFKEEDGNGCVKAEPIKNFIKQLLKEREREVLERLIEKRTRLLFTEDWFVWLTDITRELDKLDGRKQ